MNGGKYLGVNYGELVPLLIEAIRELDKKFQSRVIEGNITATRGVGSESCDHLGDVMDKLQTRLNNLEMQHEELQEIYKKKN